MEIIQFKEKREKTPKKKKKKEMNRVLEPVRR